MKGAVKRSSPICARVLYTKHLVKRKKTYHDGFLKLHEDRSASLLDEEGQRMANARLPQHVLPLSAETEGLDDFEGYLVNYDEACTPADIPRPTESPAAEQRVPPKAQALQRPQQPKELHDNISYRPFVSKFQRPQMKPPMAAASPAQAEGSSCTDQAGILAMKVPGARTDEEILGMFARTDCSLEHPSANPQSDSSSKKPVQQHSKYARPCPSSAAQAPAVHLQATDSTLLQRPQDEQEPRDLGPGGTAHEYAASRWAMHMQPCSLNVEEPASVVKLPVCEGEWKGLADSSSGWNIMQGLESRMRSSASDPARAQPPKNQFKMPGFQDTAKAQARTGNAHEASEGIRFPSPEEAAPQFRKCPIEDEYDSTANYRRDCLRAVEEEIGLRVAEIGRQFYRILGQHSASSKTGRAPDLVSAMRRGGVMFYDDCQLLHFPKRPDWDKLESFYLVLNGSREASKAYRQDDLWILSDQQGFTASGKSCKTPRSNSSWVACARSNWHGPNKDGKMQISFFSKPPFHPQKKQQVFAIHGSDISMELAMQDSLNSQDENPATLLPTLLIRPQDPDSRMRQPEGKVATAEKIASEFRLNEDQAGALNSTVGWFGSEVLESSSDQLPVCIIHGPFGSGKSTLLVAMLTFFATQLAEQRQSGKHYSSGRILMAAHTNMAVDRVLNGLLDRGFTDFIRVGSIRRIDRRLLPYSLHSRQNNGKSEAASELADMLKGCSNPQEAELLKQELAELKAGAEKKRKQLLKKVSIVGVTCCSITQPLLDSLSFNYCVLDECSQIVEPLSLLTISRAKCRYLVAAGDCCQLPPLIASPSTLQSQPGSEQAHGLGRPLIARLMALGYPSHLLRYQYRCHPSLSAIPNHLFYEGKLLDGCSAADREPLVAGLPELLCIHAPGSCASDAGQSFSNKGEARCISTVVKRLIAAGVAAEAIGIICFFRAQVALVKGLLGATPTEDSKGGAAPPTVATVDSFQGMEKEVIILSITVTRSGPFASDAQRLNVALTRARRHLILVGDLNVASQLAPAFALLIDKATRRPGGVCSNAAAFVL